MKIIKRNGSYVNFDASKIESAIEKCYFAIWKNKTEANKKAKQFTEEVISCLNPSFDGGYHIEQIQNLVEQVLVNNHEYDAYEQYASYRHNREIAREIIQKIEDLPESSLKSFSESGSYFSSELSLFQYYSKSSRYDWNLNRRETWKETIQRNVNQLIRFSQNKLSSEDYVKIENAMITMDVLPSMRLLAMAGPAAERDNVCIYNCSFMAIDDLYCFKELLHISMCGCGTGFSTERYYISKLPIVQLQNNKTLRFLVEDTTEGWGNIVYDFIRYLFEGFDVDVNYSQLRPAGSVLKIKGGRASGPEPLQKSLSCIKDIILGAQGRQLTSVEIGKICCLLGDCAISGGVRRTAMIWISDFDDVEVANLKSGNWYIKYPYLSNANISASFIRNYSYSEIHQFVTDMDNSRMGERGIFSPINAVKNSPSRRITRWEEELGIKIDLQDIDSLLYAARLLKIGTNPCGEINIRTFCNLTANVLRKKDSFEDLLYKQTIATIIGTIQSNATYFPHLRSHWKKITENERLLGVDLLGLADYGYLNSSQLEKLKEQSIKVNKEYAAILRINESSAITCIKPGGNSGALVDASSSLSKRKYKYAIRNVEVDIRDPIYKVLRWSKVPGFPKPGKETTTYLFSIPIKSPEGSLLLENDPLIDQLNEWKKIKLHYTEHNPSCSIYYKENELFDLIDWIYSHQDIIGGLAFFPNADLSKLNVTYLPIQKIEEDEYNKRVAEFPKIRWELLAIIEKEDMTNSSRELACAGDKCETL